MKYWVSHLPLEVWVDVYRYPWITREELGRIVDRFRNRKFAEYLQFFLHDWGKHKLNWLCFDKSGMYKNARQAPLRRYMDFPLTPIPDKIISFERISIEHFDTQNHNFMRQITPILTNVQLELSRISRNNLASLRVILAHLVPLIDGIHSLTCSPFKLPTVKQYLAERFAKLKALSIVDHNGMDGATQQTMVNLVTNWLTSPQDGNGPKLFEALISYNDTAFGQLSSAIRQQFFAATHPCTFALTLWIYPFGEFDEFLLYNNIGEELHGLQIGHNDFRITRHQTSRGTELQEWIKQNQAKRYRSRIEIINPTIGIIDANDAPENVGKAKQKPSTSKKA